MSASAMSTPIIVSWCPGDPCDPCKEKTGNIEISGNLGIGPGYPGTNVWVTAGGSILSFPEFPVRVDLAITLKGIYRPFLGTISNDGGTARTSGQSDTLGVACPLPPTYLEAIADWDPNGMDLLWFDVKATSSTTSAAWLSVSSLNVLFHPEPGAGEPFEVSTKTRWTGAITG